MMSNDLTVRNLPDPSTKLTPHPIHGVRPVRRIQHARGKLDTTLTPAHSNLPNNLTIKISDNQRILHHCKSNTTGARHRSETLHDRGAHNKTSKHFLHPIRNVLSTGRTNIGSPAKSFNIVHGQRDLTGNERYFTHRLRVNVEPRRMRERIRRPPSGSSLNGSAGMLNNRIMSEVVHKSVPDGTLRSVLPSERVNVQLNAASPHSDHHGANRRPARRHYQSRKLVLVNMETILIGQGKNAVIDFRHTHHGSQPLTSGTTIVRKLGKIGGHNAIGQKNVLPVHYLHCAVQPNAPRPIRDVNGEMRVVKHSVSPPVPCVCVARIAGGVSVLPASPTGSR
uniref:Uncharacterized protein n=1 Tax=Siphoviridae sp. ctQ091 TaxID=2825490 RepID=A0A8S5NUL0_9CAUD|nr:MAG TPA: hypothetical protein [Siphoviridae sp. ctQ091]